MRSIRMQHGLSGRLLRRTVDLVSGVAARIRTWQIFVLALAFRLPLVWLRPQDRLLTENLRAGFTLAKRGYFGDPFPIPTGPTAHLSPAYPALVAAVRSITPSDDVCIYVLSIIFAIVTSCNVAALIPISRALKLPRGSGTIATLIWLIPWFAWIELTPEHETPLTVAALLTLVTIVARITASARPTVAAGARLGLAAGLAAYFTPMALPMATFATFAGARVRRWKMQSLLTVATGAVLLFAMAILPYTLRNYHTLGQWVFMRDNFGIELAMSNGPGARATTEENSSAGGTLERLFNSRAAVASLRDLGEVEYYHRQQSAAVAWIKANPRAFLTLVAKRAGYLILPLSKRWYQSAVADAISLMSIAGGVLLWRSRYRLGVRCLAASIVGYLLVFLLIEHDIRYMYPALYLESLLAGSCAIALLRIWRDPQLLVRANGVPSATN
jgi:hypothetical protein